MVRWLGLWFVGCSLVPPAPLETDVVNGRLTEGSSLCEYEAVAPDFPPAETGGTWLPNWEASPYLDCADGQVDVRSTVFESGSGRSRGFSVDVQLYEVLEPFTGHDVDPTSEPRQVDDCIVVEHARDLSTHAQEQVAFLDAPLALLEIGDWRTRLVDERPDAGSRTYSKWLGDVDIPDVAAHGGGVVSVSVSEGGTAPAMELEGLMRMPASLFVIAPDMYWGAPLPREDVPFEWTSGDDGGVLRIHMLARADYQEQEFPTYEVTCEVADDGSWVMPASVLQALPAGWVVQLAVERRSVDWVGTHNGGAIRTWASASHVGANLKLGD